MFNNTMSIDQKGSRDALTIRFHEHIRDIPRQDWDRLSLGTETPLLEWEWLRCMEESGSISPEEGWIPHHIGVYDNDRLVGAAPLYVKTHSMGEFVFDFAFADVAHQLGASYYPKLVGMSPATPSSAFAFLTEDGPDEAEIQAVMAASILEMAEETGMGGVAFNFADPKWMNGAGKAALEQYDFVGWTHQLYHWRNRGFTSFDDYIACFTKNQRRNIRRERESMDRQGIRIVIRTGDDITPELLDYMYDFYAAHNARFGPWAARFLNRQFFRMLADGFRDRIALVCAYSREQCATGEHSLHGQRPIAMAFLLVKNRTMWGRYWGADEEIRDLHFNCCYYKPIEWAIENGYELFDPGMGSSHKVRRGFEAVSGYSLHHFLDERMQYILHNNIDRINSMESAHVEQLNAARPVQDNPYRGVAG